MNFLRKKEERYKYTDFKRHTMSINGNQFFLYTYIFSLSDIEKPFLEDAISEIMIVNKDNKIFGLFRIKDDTYREIYRIFANFYKDNMFNLRRNDILGIKYVKNQIIWIGHQ